MGKHEEEFEGELDELIAGISKIKNHSKLFSKENIEIDSDNKAIKDHNKEQHNLSEPKRQNYRPECVMAISSSIYFKFWYSG